MENKKAKFGVEIVSDRYPITPREKERLKEIFSILEELAKLWQISISVDFPNSNTRSPVDDEKLHLYLYGVPPLKEGERYLNVKCSQIFGYLLPRELTGWGYLIPKEDKVIISPEGDVIAKVLPGNIYIPFSFGHQEWQGRESILSQILEEAIPLSLEERPDFSSKKKIYAQLNRIAELRRKNFLKSITRVKKDFIDLWTEYYIEELEKIEKTIKEQRQSHEKLWQEVVQLDFQAKLLSGQLQDLEKRGPIQEEECARDFDLILKMKQVKGVKVDQFQVIVFTHPILMDGRYDIGDWEIDIPYKLSLTRESISFKQGSHSGKHKHNYIQERNTCFGTLNSEINKLLPEGDILRVIQWCLFFLEEEANTLSRLRKAPSDEKPPEQFPEAKPFYPSIEEREAERQKYMTAVRTIREKTLKELTEKELNRINSNLPNKSKSFVEARQRLRASLASKSYIEKTTLSMDSFLGGQFDEISRQVVEIKAVDSFCQILFRDKNKNLVRIWLRPDRKIIWARGYNLSYPYLSERGNITLPEDFQKGIFNLLKERRILDAFRVLRELAF